MKIIIVIVSAVNNVGDNRSS